MNNLFIFSKDLLFVQSLFNFIVTHDSKVRLQGFYSSEKEFIKIMNSLCSTDVLIFDLDNNSFPLLTHLIHMLPFTPYIITISNSTTNLKKYANYISFNYHKHCSFDSLINKINNIASIYSSDKIRQRILQELSLFEFNQYCLGFKFLVDCISLAYENTELLFNMKNNLYVQVSSKYSSFSSEKVKWNLHRCLDSMYRYTDSKNIYQYFSFNYKPSPKIFISTVVEKLRRQEHLKLI